jgi:hypothetical protein
MQIPYASLYVSRRLEHGNPDCGQLPAAVGDVFFLFVVGEVGEEDHDRFSIFNFSQKKSKTAYGVCRSSLFILSPPSSSSPQ